MIRNYCPSRPIGRVTELKIQKLSVRVRLWAPNSLKGNIMLEVVYVLMFFSVKTIMIELKRYDDPKVCQEVSERLNELTKRKVWSIGTYHCVIFPK